MVEFTHVWQRASQEVQIKVSILAKVPEGHEEEQVKLL